jgi:large subunit ribosomal protein L19
MRNRLLTLVEEAGAKKDIVNFQIGDQVDVHQRILEGSKERVQIFSGTVIARRGDGLRETFTVRRIVQGEGVERIFPLHSPKIAKIEVKRTGRVRRAKLYYLRKRVGKATRLRERKEKGAAVANGSTLRDGKTGKGKGKGKAQAAVATEETTGAKTT